MKLLDSMTRVFILQGTGERWLREELHTLDVRIPLTDGCLAELVQEADDAVRRAGGASDRSYVERLRKQLGAVAAFIHTWTGSDDKIALDNEKSLQALVRIARKYALPRPWKLSEPVVVEYLRLQPSYLNWTAGIDSNALPQA